MAVISPGLSVRMERKNVSGKMSGFTNAISLRDSIQEYVTFVSNHPMLASDRIVRTLVLDPDELEEYAIARPTEQIGILVRNRFITVLNDVVESIDSDGNRHRYGYLRVISNTALAGGCGTVIIAKVCNPDLFGYGGYVLIKQERHATGKTHLEFPRGFGTIGLSAKENALKELREETGLIGENAVSLGKTYPDSGLLGDSTEFIYIPVVNAVGATPEQGEAVLSWSSISLPELRDYLAKGEIDDGFTVQAIGLLAAHSSHLRESLPIDQWP